MIIFRLLALVVIVGSVLIPNVSDREPPTYVYASVAPMTYTDPPPTYADGWPHGARYRIGAWLCVASDENPDRDPCVHDPDPVGDPVAVEPDNGIVAASEVPRGLQPNGSVAVSQRQDGPYDDAPGDSVLTGHDCRRHGNGVCGPRNDGGFTPGCYVRTGQRAGTLLEPWRDEWLTRTEYRPCGSQTAKDRAMTERLNGGPGLLCATTGPCWTADQPRPEAADGPARFVPNGGTAAV